MSRANVAIADDRHAGGEAAGRGSALQRIEACAPFILGMLEEAPDITLSEMQTQLAGERRVRVGIGPTS